MKHKKHLRKQGGNASGGNSNGNQSDENCEEKSNDGSIAEVGDIDDINDETTNRERGTYVLGPAVCSFIFYCIN